MDTRKKLLGEILEERGLITPAQLNEALHTQKSSGGKRLGEVLEELGYITAEQLIHALSEQFDIEMVDIKKMKIPATVIDSVPEQTAKNLTVLPIERTDGVLTVAMSDPLDLLALDMLRFATNCDIRCVLAPKKVLEEQIIRYYGAGEETLDDMLMEFTEGDITFVEDANASTATSIEESEETPVIRLVSLIISEAVRAGASDIHIEPMESRLRIRYRIDGVCFEQESPPKRLQGPIIARVKIMAKIDIAEKRRPTDGRIKVKMAGRDLDLRVSCLPASQGESVVMRILDKQSIKLGVQELGLHESDNKKFHSIISRPYGIFLVTGPTGSGKTTTLYAALNELNKPNVKIITAENPVEYKLSGINQAEVNDRIGMTFSRILRSMLRQAPNIILVGEIRDSETAEIAIQAALTGHLVFSTLHTNDAASAITRLIDMGIKPFLVASAVQATMAQRLIRTICEGCKTPYQPNAEELATANLTEDDIKGITLYKGKGCEKCGKTGYKGRRAIFELMELDSELRDMAFNMAPLHKIKAQAKNSGMTTLFEDGIRKVLQGVTTIPEVLSTTQEDIH